MIGSRVAILSAKQGGLPGWVLAYDPMDGGSISSLWEVNDGSGPAFSANDVEDRIDIDIDFNTNSNHVRGASADTSISSPVYMDDDLIMQFDVINTNYSGPSEAPFIYLGLMRGNESQFQVNSANIITRGTSGFDDQSVQARIWQGNVDREQEHQAIDISTWKTFYIKALGDDISFYYWNGSAQVEIGSGPYTHNIRLAQGLRMYVKYKQLAGEEDNLYGIRNFYLSSRDYTTQNPG